MEKNAKEKILDAAIDLFSENGFVETSVREIAEKVKILPGSLYAHYRSKDELLIQILDEYIQYCTNNIPSLEHVRKLMEETDRETVINSIFFRFTPENTEKYSKTLKIILHEQYRNEIVQGFMKDYFIEHVENYIAEVLQMLMEAGKIKSADSRLYAKLINTLNISTVIEYSHYSLEEYHSKERVSREEILEFFINEIILLPEK